MVTKACWEAGANFEPCHCPLSVLVPCLLTSVYSLAPVVRVSQPAGAWGGEEVPFPSLLQVAVKLSGWRWRGRQALRLYPRAELGPVVDTVLALLEKLEEEESVLVEAVCPPARLPFPGENHLCWPRLELVSASCLLRAQASASSSRQPLTWP